MAGTYTVGWYTSNDSQPANASEWPECYPVHPEDETFYTHSLLEAAIVTVLMPLIIVLGTVGNACVVYAFAKQQKLRTVTNSYLVNLAVADLVILLCAGPITVVQYATSPIPNDFSVLGPWSCKLVGYLVDTSLVVSCSTIVLVTAERYLAICWPVAFMSARHAHAVPPTCAVLWIAAALFKVPAAYFGSVQEVCLDWSLVPGKESHPPSRVVNCLLCSTYQAGCQAYSKYIHFDQILPLLAVPVLAILYTLMVRRLTRRTRVGASREAARRKRQVVQLLIMTGTVYLVCHAPFRVINFLNYYGYIGADIVVCWQVGRLMLYANSAVNPAIYNASSEAYRALFCKSLQLDRCASGDQRSPEDLLRGYPKTTGIGGARTHVTREGDSGIHSQLPSHGVDEGAAAVKTGGKKPESENNNGVLENNGKQAVNQEKRGWSILDKYKAHLKVPSVHHAYLAVDTEIPTQSTSVTPTSEISNQSKESVV